MAGLVPAVYEITTPENVAFRYERAGVSSRALAWAIDVAVMGLGMQIAVTAVSFLGVVLGGFANALVLVALFLVQWWYAAIAEWRFSGQTIGKWALGIRTMDAAGLPLTLFQAAVRNLLRVLDFIPGLYLVGGLWALLDPHGRRLGDLAARTVVVKEPRAVLPMRLLSDVTREAASIPGLAEMVSRLNHRERDAVIALAAQRDRLPLDVRLAAFGELAQLLEARHGVTRPAHVSAEKLVLSACAELVQRAKRRAQES